ncbi:MAG: hypothetical protein ACLT3Y_05165 [Ruminococcus callidus]
MVKQAVLDQLKASGQCAVFVVYSDQGEVLYGWLVRGSQLTATGDWTLGQNVTVTEDGGVQISGNGVWYGTLRWAVHSTMTRQAAMIRPAIQHSRQTPHRGLRMMQRLRRGRRPHHRTPQLHPLHRCRADL